MANNRMFLVHEPSGIGLMLGKVLGQEWYKPPEQERFQEFYDYIYTTFGYGQEDFILVTESSENWACLHETSLGFRQLVRTA